MEYTQFQTDVQNRLKNGKSLILIAPTGLGKTLAVVGDIQEKFCKMIYAVPLRSLGIGIKEEISNIKRNEKNISPVIHHGDNQESNLFSEEVIVTTYDQIVCGMPGLPLSLPLKAGHAVAGAILMSRLVLDEAHLAWGISDKALSILLAIINFRQKLGLQTVLLTATLPEDIVKLIAERLNIDWVMVGKGDLKDDEALQLRERNRKVKISKLTLENIGKGKEKRIDWRPLDDNLIKFEGKRIYFANTVERLQDTYDRLIKSGLSADKITILHNRMPRSMRAKAEKEAYERFGKNSANGNWLLLTNQVAEAGLDISAPLVISDPAPVDTLVQRAGRCARWFREKLTEGEFLVITATKEKVKELSTPYRSELTEAAIKSIPENQLLNWEKEVKWIADSWGKSSKKSTATKSVQESLDEMTFALNLFDRAAQEHKPGDIANVFREILSVEVAVEKGSEVRLDDLADRTQRQYPETSSISIGTAYSLLNKGKRSIAVIRYDNEGKLNIRYVDYIVPGDVLILPSTLTYLHNKKGLCFGDGSNVDGAILSSEWLGKRVEEKQSSKIEGRHQLLLEHSLGVMNRVYERLKEDGTYREVLMKMLKVIEPDIDTKNLVDLIAQISALAAGFHDLGKSSRQWQDKAREIDPECPSGLIGRTAKIEGRIGIPHTPPGYEATLKACELLIGCSGSSEYLIRSVALASARHHSSLLNPAIEKEKYQYEPHPETIDFVKSILKEVGAPESIIEKSDEILQTAKIPPQKDNIPLLLPNNDLFPIYAIVGRAILMADREDASGKVLEDWRAI